MPYDPFFDENQGIPSPYGGSTYGGGSSAPIRPSYNLQGQHEHPTTHQDISSEDELQPPSPTHPRKPSPKTTSANKVTVVLQSSPITKSEFTKLPPFEEKEELEEEPSILVTSDLLSQPPPKRLKTSSPTPKPLPTMPSTTSIPFPLPVVTSTPQPKKRGRPFGWRPGSGPYRDHVASGAATTSVPRPKGRPPGRPPKPKPPRASGGVEKRRPGRPPKFQKEELTARQIYLRSSPKFIPFLCEWDGCPAELQNIETLRRHLLIVHGKGVEVSGCRWAGCNASQESKEGFERHVEERHLIPFVWHCGDGPRNHSGEVVVTKREGIPGYLLDKEGEQVTPSVQGQEVEGDEEAKERRARVNRVIAQSIANAPTEREYTEEETQAMGEAVRAKSKRLRMYKDYMVAVCGAEGVQPRYGKEWLGGLYRKPIEEK